MPIDKCTTVRDAILEYTKQDKPMSKDLDNLNAAFSEAGFAADGVGGTPYDAFVKTCPTQAKPVDSSKALETNAARFGTPDDKK